MIRTENITQTYLLHGQPLRALDGVSLHISRGEYAAIVGPSGSGKSTLMNILGCLDTPASGRYILDGQDVSSLRGNALARVRGEKIGFVFQGFHLLDRLTALENVALPLLFCGVPSPKRMAIAKALLERVGLAHRMEHLPCQLSGGQMQRVAVARALVRQPPVILADEPTGNLDEEATATVMDLLDDLHHEGRTVLLITHDPQAALRAKRQIVLSGGKITADSAFFTQKENSTQKKQQFMTI